MSRRLRVVGITVAAVAVVAVAAIAALPFLVDTPRIQSLIAGSASQALGRSVTFTSVSFRAFPWPAVELRGLAVAEDPRFGAAPFLRLDRGSLRLRLAPLLGGRIEFGDLVLKQPHIALIENADGRWNVASLGTVREPSIGPRGSAPAPDHRGGSPAVGIAALASRITIDDGVVTYLSHRRPAAGEGPQYRLEDVDLAISGGALTLAFEGDAVLRPGDLTIKIKDGAVLLSGARTAFDAPLRGSVVVETADVGRVVAAATGPTPTVGGGLKGTLVLGGTVGDPTATGDLAVSGLTVTQSRPECRPPKERTLKLGGVTLNAVFAEDRVSARPLTASFADATITTNLAAVLGGRVRVELNDLAVKALPLDRVLVDFLCIGYAVTGPLDLKGVLTMVADDPWHTLSGDGRFTIGRGKIVGSQAQALLGGVTRAGGALSSLLGQDVPPALASSPLEFESITGTYRIRNGVASSRDVVYTTRGLVVRAAGEYVLASGRINADMIVDHGRGELKARVTGTAAAPSLHVVPTTTIVRGADPRQAERGLRELLKQFR